MVNDKTLIKNLNKIFTNQKFMKSIIEQENGNIEGILYKMGIVLQYYITTRDENIDVEYSEIEDKYFQAINENERENIIENGFMTHSFNGYKKDLIQKKGLNYGQNLSPEEEQEIDERRDLLNYLEDILGVSNFIENQRERNTDYSNSVFVCSPGAKTFHYACKRSPERLYVGPLKGYENEPVIVGESKITFLTRVLEKRIKERSQKENWNEEQYKDAIQTGRKIAKIYGKSRPAFAMLKIRDMKDVGFSQVDYDKEKTESLIQKLERVCDDFRGARGIFSQNPSDGLETNNLGDLVTLAEFIPQNSISIVECMDEFEIMQIYAKTKGLKTGDYMDYSQDKKLGNPTIAELIELIDDCKDSKSIYELEEKYKAIKLDTKCKIDEISKKISKQYGENPLEIIEKQLLEQKQKLKSEEQAIFDKDYIKKVGIDESYTLEDCVKTLKQKGLMHQLLEKDEIIKNDDLQYSSEIHGVSHTRRVNFFATLIMNFENVDDRNAKLIDIFAKNHDIGRINDNEDKEHGKNSVNVLEDNPERLEGLSEKEKEKVKFFIKEHSLSNLQNQQDLQQLFKEKTEQAKIERFNKLSEKAKQGRTPDDIRTPNLNKEKEEWEYILNICKDADKLDRVRLDPRGIYEAEGLDSARLSLEISKKLENVAYESQTKILRILDIEKELQNIDEKLNEVNELKKLKQDYSKSTDFEIRIQQAKENNSNNKKRFLSTMIKEKRISKIAEIPKKIKALFLTKENNREEFKE